MSMIKHVGGKDVELTDAEEAAVLADRQRNAQDIAAWQAKQDEEAAKRAAHEALLEKQVEQEAQRAQPLEAVAVYVEAKGRRG